MSKMRGVFAVRVAIDPANTHVEASRLELLREPEQRLSLLARHRSLARRTRPDRPAFVAQRAPLARASAEPSHLRLRNRFEKAQARR